MSVPLPTPSPAVIHSPTPSTVRIAASSKGAQKNALAACERWCSLNRILLAGTPDRRPGRGRDTVPAAVLEPQRVGHEAHAEGEGRQEHEVEEGQEDAGLEIADLAADALPAPPETAQHRGHGSLRYEYSWL